MRSTQGAPSCTFVERETVVLETITKYVKSSSSSLRNLELSVSMLPTLIFHWTARGQPIAIMYSAKLLHPFIIPQWKLKFSHMTKQCWTISSGFLGVLVRTICLLFNGHACALWSSAGFFLTGNSKLTMCRTRLAWPSVDVHHKNRWTMSILYLQTSFYHEL